MFFLASSLLDTCNFYANSSDFFMEMYACVKDGKEHEQNAKCAYQTNVMTTMMMKYIEKEAEQKPIDAYQANKFSIQRMRIFSFLAHAAKLFYELFEVVCEFFCCFFFANR